MDMTARCRHKDKDVEIEISRHINILSHTYSYRSRNRTRKDTNTYLGIDIEIGAKLWLYPCFRGPGGILCNTMLYWGALSRGTLWNTETLSTQSFM